jgi:transmembrane sensor
MSAPDRKVFVQPPIDDARIERQWSAIEAAGLPVASRCTLARGAWLAFGVGLLTASAAAMLVLRKAPALEEGAVVESGLAEVSVRLDDGSHVQLEPDSSLRLLSNRASSVEVELRDGRARFDVVRDRKRPFKVMAGDAEVRVVGTRFSVASEKQASGMRIEVRVSDGVVEVQRHDEASVRELRAGERLEWIAGTADEARAKPAEAANAPGPEEPVLHEASLDEHAAPEANAPERAVRGTAHAPAETEGSVAELFRQATLARRAGRMREAAEAYSELLTRHPSDSRAGLSAFELGRLRMDALDDAQGAIAALEQALRVGQGASFHEDALARIVIASDALGRTEACERARARYLEHYPAGVHAIALAQRCK